VATTEIIPDYDGDVNNYPVRTTGGTTWRVGTALVGKLTYSYRAFLRCPNTALPAGTITQVELFVYPNTAGGAGHLADVHAYRSNGQPDPEAEPNDWNLYNYCASGNLYLDDTTALRSAVGQWLTLGGTVVADITAARDAGTPFSLALHEELDNDPAAYVWASEAGLPNAVRIRVTYTPPPAVGPTWWTPHAAI